MPKHKTAKKFSINICKVNSETYTFEVIAYSVLITSEIINGRKLFSLETDRGGCYKLINMVFAERIEIITEEPINEIDIRSQRLNDFVGINDFPLNYFIDDIVKEK